MTYRLSELLIPSLTPAYASGTVTSNNTNVSVGDTVTVGTQVYTFDDNLAAVAASGVLTSDNTNVSAGDTVTIGTRTYEFDEILAAVKASETLTSDGVNVTADDSITLGDVTYTFKSSLTEPAAANEVLIGASAAATLDNLKSAVNGTAGEGTTYSTGTVAHPDVEATDNADTTQKFEARVAGDAGNYIVFTESSTHLSITSGTGVLQSGADDPGADTILIGADADTSLGNLKAAINLEAGAGTKYSVATTVHPDVTCGTIAAHAMTITAKVAGAAGNEIAKAETSTHLDWDGTGEVLSGGDDAEEADTILIGADANASLTNLAHAINGTGTAGTNYATGTIARTDVAASVNGTTHVLTLTAVNAGVAANSIALAKEATTLTVSNTTLSGGSGGECVGITIDKAGTYNSDPMDVGAFTEGIAFLNVKSHAGTNPTLDVKFQASHNKTTWVDIGDAFTQVTTTDSLTLKRLTANFGKYLRAVITVGGTLPDYNFDLSIAFKG